jgi:HK97 family phage portal protein
MGWRDLARRVLGGSVDKSNDFDAWFDLGGGNKAASGLSINQSTAVSISTVYACTSIRSKDVARCRPRLMRQNSARSEKPVSDHPIAKLFVSPNDWQTWTEFARQMHAAYLLRGNAYAVILRNSRGEPAALIPINPDYVTLYEAPGGELFYSVTRSTPFLTAVLRGNPLMIPEDDIFHLRELGFHMLFGLSRISIARDSFGLALGLEQQASRFMANGARPSGVLQSDKSLSVEAAIRLRTQWEQLRAGIQNAGKTAILEDGVKWNAMQLSSVDLEFIAQRTFSIGEIARWFDMPLYKLGVAQEMARIKFDDADQAYVNTTIMPDLDIWEEKFAQKFGLSDQKLVVDFDERRLLRAAEATRINNQRLKIMSGISTQNECRAENGDPPLPGGDVLLTPVNLAASGSDMSGTAPDGSGRPSDGTLPDPGAANDEKSKRYAAILRDATDRLENAGPDEAYEILKSIPEKIRQINIVPYVIRDQSAFVQNLLPPPSDAALPSPGADQ